MSAAKNIYGIYSENVRSENNNFAQSFFFFLCCEIITVWTMKKKLLKKKRKKQSELLRFYKYVTKFLCRMLNHALVEPF